MMRGLAGLRHRQVTRMNVPVHQVMFTPDRNALPPPAAEKIRSRTANLVRESRARGTEIVGWVPDASKPVLNTRESNLYGCPTHAYKQEALQI
jgi:hypothetical protein